MSLIAIVDYGSGNLRSAEKALQRVAVEFGDRHEIVVTADAEQVRRADRIVLPGVGAFADCMDGIQKISGLVETLEEVVVRRGKPFLGICVGMQLLADTGHEFGDHPGLGWIGGNVEKIAPSDPSLKIPHMGWNELNIIHEHPLLRGIPEHEHAYFVHSYCFQPRDAGNVVATTDYGQPLTAMIAKGNIAGTQFHPEKSQTVGLTLLRNFLEWRP